MLTAPLQRGGVQIATPVCQESDSEEMTGQLSSKIVLQCESCCFKTSRLSPSIARQKLAAHMAGHLKAQKEPMEPTDVKEGLDREGDHSVP